MGGTGDQGGGLVQAIVNDRSGAYTACALTRKVDSEKAKSLAAQGAKVVAADPDDLDSLTQAFTGCDGAFCVTNFWEHFTPAKELAQAQNLAKAAKQAGLAHVIWSTLEDTRRWVPLSDDRMPTLQENFKLPHFDSKGEANAIFTELGVPTTFLHTSFYWDNFIHFGMGPKKGPDGKFAITLPMEDKKLPGIAASDIGACAFGIFKKGKRAVGKIVGIAGEHLTGAQMAGAFSLARTPPGSDVLRGLVGPEQGQHSPGVASVLVLSRAQGLHAGEPSRQPGRVVDEDRQMLGTDTMGPALKLEVEERHLAAVAITGNAARLRIGHGETLLSGALEDRDQSADLAMLRSRQIPAHISSASTAP